LGEINLRRAQLRVKSNSTLPTQILFLSNLVVATYGMSGAKLVGRGAQGSIGKVKRELNWSASVPGDGGVVVRRQEGGRGLELRGGGAPAGYVDEPPPPRPAAVVLRHLIPWQSLLQGGRGCLLSCLVCLGMAGRAWSWRRGTGHVAGRRRHPTSSCVWKEKH
jgi:hypothetical protein